MQTNKLREALTKILNLTNSLDEDCAVDPVEIRDIAKDALAEPVRNYEVGAEGEQTRRFLEFCNAHDCERGCPLLKTDSCELAWAQMPYSKEGGDK